MCHWSSWWNIHLSEDQKDLASTLPTVVRQAPYRWAFGDGASALGHGVVHRYQRPGLYHVWVSGYEPQLRHWFVFDSALVRVVPADQILSANLAYDALRTVMALTSLTFPVEAVLFLVVVVVFARRWPRPEPETPSCAE